MAKKKTDQLKELMERSNKFYKVMEGKYKVDTIKIESKIKEMFNVLKSHESILEKILETNQNVDETLCNVLLAIRQNEYLQAWYPPQRGQPEQMVVGKYVQNVPAGLKPEESSGNYTRKK